MKKGCIQQNENNKDITVSYLSIQRLEPSRVACKIRVFLENNFD